MYEKFVPDFISDEEMKEVLENGECLITRDNNVEVTSYLYNAKIYITNIKEIEKNE